MRCARKGELGSEYLVQDDIVQAELWTGRRGRGQIRKTAVTKAEKGGRIQVVPGAWKIFPCGWRPEQKGRKGQGGGKVGLWRGLLPTRLRSLIPRQGEAFMLFKQN